MTPEEFQDRFYLLLKDIMPEGKADIDAFKAKGDSARIYADLNTDYIEAGLIGELLDLTFEFGAVLPSRPKDFFSPASKYELREFTLGELKTVIRSGRWPEGTWLFVPVPLSLWLPHFLVILLGAGCAVFGLVLSLLSDVWPFLRTPAWILMCAFLALGLLARFDVMAKIGKLIKKAFTKPALP